MKNILYIFIFITIAGQIGAQINFVPNPSFEDTVGSCVSTVNGIQKARHWKDFSTSCDYYNSCANPSQLGVPYNLNGYQNAASGDAYVGFGACHDTTTSSVRNIRETFGAKLTNTLTVGQKYFVSFKVVGTAGWCWGCSKIGVKFTTFDVNPPLYANNYLINNISQVFSNSIINDTINWTTIKGSFIADSSYEYIIVGHFFQDYATQTTPCWPTYGGYFLADDICVSLDSNYCAVFTYIKEKNKKQSLSLYPNPVSETLFLEGADVGIIDQINVLNYLGQTIYTYKELPDNKINIRLLSDGLYFLEVFSNGTIYYDKILVKH
jgi:hypothetical protein